MYGKWIIAHKAVFNKSFALKKRLQLANLEIENEDLWFMWIFLNPLTLAAVAIKNYVSVIYLMMV